MILWSLTFLRLIIFGSCLLSASESEISLSLMKHLNIHQCILSVDELGTSVFNAAKSFGYSQISTTFKTNEDFENYIIKKDFSDFKSGTRPCLYPWRIAVVWKSDVNTFNTRLNREEVKEQIS